MLDKSISNPWFRNYKKQRSNERGFENCIISEMTRLLDTDKGLYSIYLGNFGGITFSPNKNASMKVSRDPPGCTPKEQMWLRSLLVSLHHTRILACFMVFSASWVGFVVSMLFFYPLFFSLPLWHKSNQEYKQTWVMARIYGMDHDGRRERDSERGTRG